MSKSNEPDACACDGKPASSGCSCDGNQPCACPSYRKSGDEDPLDVMDEFKKFYQDKMKQIDEEGGGDCTELKLKLQERWIDDLTEQTRLMANIVKDLEEEATTKVRMLENKLKQTSKAAYEENASSVENQKPPDYEGLLRKKSDEYEALRQSMLDMRSALTEEVACKHDMILALKKDVLQLEERCVQADKQTAFKDDIIKELRKEIKQLKQQESHNVPLFKQLRVRGSKTVLTTIKHSRNTEQPKCSTVIFINDSRSREKYEKTQKSNKNERMDLEISPNKVGNNLLNASYWKDTPVKEKSKFTVTNLNKTFSIRSDRTYDVDSIGKERYI